ncbi:MAG TPA: sensor domain-containing protein, partial [Streptomyces sp.]|nr:sensor domain-containing protein [Streptomyces sp.]
MATEYTTDHPYDPPDHRDHGDDRHNHRNHRYDHLDDRYDHRDHRYGHESGHGYRPGHAPGHGDRGTASPMVGGMGMGMHERRRRLPAVLRAPFEGRHWREFGFVLLSLPISVLLFVYAVTTVSLGAGLLVTFLGIPVLAAALAGCRGFGALERARARGLLGLEVGEPEPLRAGKPGMAAWVGAVLKSGTSWRAVLYAVL